ncbi:MAG: hypothetical protein H7124_16040 [Phycisphaerales bacterium]|nr:hypothetical protein [Hyphomonadaceae bacterium]
MKSDGIERVNLADARERLGRVRRSRRRQVLTASMQGDKRTLYAGSISRCGGGLMA